MITIRLTAERCPIAVKPNYKPDTEMLKAYDIVKHEIESTENADEFNNSLYLIDEHYDKYKDRIALQYLLRVKDQHAFFLITRDEYKKRKIKNLKQ